MRWAALRKKKKECGTTKRENNHNKLGKRGEIEKKDKGLVVDSQQTEGGAAKTRKPSWGRHINIWPGGKGLEEDGKKLGCRRWKRRKKVFTSSPQKKKIREKKTPGPGSGKKKKNQWRLVESEPGCITCRRSPPPQNKKTGVRYGGGTRKGNEGGTKSERKKKGGSLISAGGAPLGAKKKPKKNTSKPILAEGFFFVSRGKKIH